MSPFVEKSIQGCSQRLKKPDLVNPGECALWRIETLNVSIRKIEGAVSGTLRYLGWEHSEAKEFQAEQNGNGILGKNSQRNNKRAKSKNSGQGLDTVPTSKPRSSIMVIMFP